LKAAASGYKGPVRYLLATRCPLCRQLVERAPLR